MKNQNKKTKQKLYEAAIQIILSKGAAHLTLDAVAKEAGVSKGGLLYHFPNKEALIRGLIEQSILEFEDDIEEERKEESGPGQWLRSYVKSSFKDNQNMALSAALLTAAMENPKLLEPLQKRHNIWQAKCEEDGIDPALATVIRFAVEGILLSEMLQFSPSEAAKKKAINLLLELAKI